jgi:hypothetical protein
LTLSSFLKNTTWLTKSYTDAMRREPICCRQERSVNKCQPPTYQRGRGEFTFALSSKESWLSLAFPLTVSPA